MDKCLGLIEAVKAVRGSLPPDAEIPALTGWEPGNLKAEFVDAVFGEDRDSDGSLWSYLTNVSGRNHLDDFFTDFHSFGDLYSCLWLLIACNPELSVNKEFCAAVFE